MSKPEYLVLVDTTKLKRFKIFSITVGIILFPIRLLLLIPYYIGRAAEWLDINVILAFYDLMERSVVRLFKLNNVALRQVEENPEKFGKPKKKFKPTIKQ